jgi:hypothetical protein
MAPIPTSVISGRSIERNVYAPAIACRRRRYRAAGSAGTERFNDLMNMIPG